MRIALLVLFVAACSKSEPAKTPPPTNPTTAGTPGTATTTPAPPPSKPEQPPPPAGENAPADKAMLPLSSYLSAAVSATFYTADTDPNAASRMKETKKLGEKEAKDYLAKLDLSQKGTGGVVRCPNDAELRFHDAGGKLLGTIGFCQEAARFDAPNGAFGGITAARP